MIPGEKQWGRLAAVNIDTGKIAWKYDTEQPLIGGVLATAGDLVFNGEGNGCFNALRRRRPARSCGSSSAAPASTRCPCRTWSAASSTSRWRRGGNTQLDFKRGNSVFVFALPE